MSCNRLIPFGAFLCVFLGIPAPGAAQVSSPRDELLQRVPRDFGLCFILQDLRGNAARWDKSPWIKALKESALGRALADTSEFKGLRKLQQDLKKYLDIDWPALRDDVLGDAVVFAYEPGPSAKPEEEQGILLVHARRPEVLARLVDNLNRAQQASGELTAMETRVHKGAKYICRLEAKGPHYYLLSGHFFAYTAQEGLLKRILEQKQENGAVPPLSQYLKNADADNAVVSVLVNPRSFDADLKQKVASVSGPEAKLLNALLKHWYALDAVVFSCTAHDNLEFKLSVLVGEHDGAAAARGLFMKTARPSDLWSRFPDNAIFSMAARMEGSDVADAFIDFAPPEVRRALQNTLQPLAALAGFDLARDIVPNVGPDCGLCVLPAAAPDKMPQIVVALGVRPGPKDIAMDQTLYRGVHFLAGLFVFEYNRRNPGDPIRVGTLRQEAVEIKYLYHDKVFPFGLKPACALKDGYLLLATAPEAIARFRTDAGSTAATEECPLARISPKELAGALRDHRQSAVEQIAAHNSIPRAAAARGFDAALSVLDLFERIEIARVGGSGQAGLVLRFNPVREK